MTNNQNNLEKCRSVNKIYSISELNIETDNTLIILDWDDTLYPTSWIIGNNIDINDLHARTKYSSYFSALDDRVNTTINKLSGYGNVVIITNAVYDWINMSSSILPKTSKSLKKIKIVSARQKFQGKFNIHEWKKNAFKDEIFDIVQTNKYNNIISIGDADYEYIALIGLWNDIPHKYLKSVKLIKSPDGATVIEQLGLIKTNASKICKAKRHLDLKFVDQ